MRRRRSIYRTDPNASPIINTTPLIDVMLVMLIMFVITIPQPTHRVDVDLPGIDPGPAHIGRENRISIDTGAFHTNVLTCLVLEGEEQRLLQTGN